MTRTLALTLLIPLAACSKPVTAAHEIFHLQEDYAEASRIGDAYASLPDCETSASPCSTPEAIAHLKALDDKAMAALMVAKAGASTKGYPKHDLEADIAAAHSAIDEFDAVAEDVMK